MKAILITRGGFKKEMHISEIKPIIEIAIPPSIDYSKLLEESVDIERKRFYLNRDFYNEDNLRVLIYEEK